MTSLRFPERYPKGLTIMKATYIKLFNIELMIESTNYLAYTYIKESRTERELQLGKLKFIISTH